MSASERTGALPPHAQLIQMGTASWVSALVYAAAKVGIADHLAGGPKSAAEAAAAMHLHAPTLHRFMRTLAGLGILTEQDGQRFALTPFGEALKTGAPGAARATLLSFCGPTFWRTWEHVAYSLETGKSAFKLTWGMPIFDFFGEHPDEAVAVQRGDGRVPRRRAAGRRASVRLFSVPNRRRRGWRHRQHARRDPVALRGAARHPVRPAAGGGERAGAARRARSRGPRDDRSGKFFRLGSGGRRLLCAVAHHSRLDGQPVRDDPRPLPERHPSRRPPADRRNRVAAG